MDDYSHGQPCWLTGYHSQLLQRKLRLFRLLDRLAFASFVDVDFNHQANLPLDGFPSDRLDRALTAGIARLPVRDGAFDVVLCSEVLEHLVRPVEAIAELLRVARKAVIVTSLEALAPGFLRRRWLRYRVDVAVPHVERKFFSMRDRRALLGTTATSRTCWIPRRCP
jgi:SAM-dependent methyltransferase